jgi:hypothetical protein
MRGPWANVSLGTVLKMDDHSKTDRLDTGPVVAFDTTKYRDLDYGYAATIHKTQGTTVDRSFVLATRHFDKHTTYVSMSRHRDDVTLCYSKENFPDFADLQSTCGRERPKHLIADFAICRGFDSGSQPPIPDERRLVQGYYTRNVNKDGEKYAVLENFETKKQHLVPFKEEYGQLKGFRLMQYDGQTLQYAPQKSPIGKTIGSQAKRLPEKEK